MEIGEVASPSLLVPERLDWVVKGMGMTSHLQFQSISFAKPAYFPQLLPRCLSPLSFTMLSPPLLPPPLLPLTCASLCYSCLPSAVSHYAPASSLCNTHHAINRQSRDLRPRMIFKFVLEHSGREQAVAVAWSCTTRSACTLIGIGP